eukprot:CAMPEP_0176456796 /NCGR_PEP_ID=MMETSP0127-20121128/31510_1 /TAXON_ID=938130 /ORGANISM="Platyophrya macrostoma, Strain WH" /LENGTH=527 /DNA_ID=CAMNT_0017846841 /DNA_START=40 /DNA_END=1623 /DNA_ORIENTATION=-
MDWKNRLGMIQNKVKGQLHARKIDDLESVGRLIQEFDRDGSGYLDQNEFTRFLSKAGIFLTTQELRSLYDLYDTNRDGNINYSEFIQIIRNEMSEKRLAVVKHAFQFLDYENRGVLSLSDLESAYRPKDHPRVRTREKTTDQVLSEFKNAIRKKSADGATVTESQFLEYYADVNATLPHEKEEYFVDLVLKTWGITTSFDYVSAERLADLEVILYEKIRQKTVGLDDEGKTMKKTFKYFDLENKGVIDIKQFTKALEHFGCVFTKFEIEALFKKYDKNNSGKLVYDEFSNLFAYMGAGTNPNVNPVFTLSRAPPKDVLKANLEDLQKRGVCGIQDLAVALRKADKNKTGKINRSSFTWAVKEVGLLMTKHDLDKLFNFLDKNFENTIDWNAYLDLLRVPLSDVRRDAVLKAFSTLDSQNAGAVHVSVLAASFNPYASSRVKNGLESADFARQAFIKDFEGLSYVSVQDFIDYYTNLNTFVSDDKKFVTYVLESYAVGEETQQVDKLSKTEGPKELNGTGKMRVTWAK